MQAGSQPVVKCPDQLPFKPVGDEVAMAGDLAEEADAVAFRYGLRGPRCLIGHQSLLTAVLFVVAFIIDPLLKKTVRRPAAKIVRGRQSRRWRPA